MDKYEILIAGIGGQGIVSLGNILGHAARLSGFKNVVGGEVHGLSQRGGSVSSYVRFGSNIHGPIIPTGSADLIIGMEFMEGIRHINRLSKEGVLVLSDTKIPSMGMRIQDIAYPATEDVLPELEKVLGKVLMFNTVRIVDRLGHLALTSTILLGAIVQNVDEFPIKEESIRRSIEFSFRNCLIEKNLMAFQEGKRLSPFGS